MTPVATTASFEPELFRALCEPVRLQLLTRLGQLGRADVASLAEGFDQDRSVISRHLQILKVCGVVIARREGRHVFYALDGPALADRLERMARDIRAAAPGCCPGDR